MTSLNFDQNISSIFIYLIQLTAIPIFAYGKKAVLFKTHEMKAGTQNKTFYKNL